MKKDASQQKPSTKAGSVSSAESILEKLEAALNSDGDFPVRTRVVNELRTLAGNPQTPIDKIVELILHEPSLGTRILHLVNSTFYQRVARIMTVSQAVVRIGMDGLVDLCAGLVLMQRFIPSAKRGGIFADNVKKCILTSLLTSSVMKRRNPDCEAEKGYLAGTFFGIGPLLLAYYFPQVCESAAQRARARQQTIGQSIAETIGLSPVDLSVGIVHALSIPEYYYNVLLEGREHHRGVEEIDEELKGPDPDLAFALAVAAHLSDVLIDSSDRAHLVGALHNIACQYNITLDEVTNVVKEIPEDFADHCEFVEMSFLTLPDHVLSFSEEEEGISEADIATVETSLKMESPETNAFLPYLDDMRRSIADGETLSSIITVAMEALAFGLEFDRVLLLKVDFSCAYLEGKMALGKPFGTSPKEIEREICNEDLDDYPDVKAYLEGTIETKGTPMFEDGSPFAVIPIGSGLDAVGVIYADRLKGPDTKPLDAVDESSLKSLADLLNEATSRM